MNYLFRLLPFLLIVCFMVSCKKDSASSGPPPATANFKATLNGANAGTPSTATGSFTGTYNSATKTLNFTLTYTGITPTAWHLHNVNNGTVEIPLGAIVPSPLESSVVLTATQENDLFENQLFVNIHSVAYAGGEISGVIMKQ